MRIGLYNLEPKIQNTAFMQISHYHKERGDHVEWYDLESQYDKVYCSSLFRFTDKSSVPSGAICGGTGFDLTTTLPFDCDLDYGLYPACDCSYVWFSRGCIRKCDFCVVNEKEGSLKVVEPKPLNPKGTYIKVQDNNFFASPNWKKALFRLWEWGQPVDFCGGIDVRLLTPLMCQNLKYTKLAKQIKIAWDNPKKDLTDDIKALLRYISPSKVMCYVLIGHDSTVDDDIKRVKAIHRLGVTPYAMCIDRNDPEQKRFQKWTNFFFHKTIEFSDFDYNKYARKRA